MPRFVKTTRLKQKTKYRAELAGTMRSKPRSWVDPFPWVHGTMPEKMVYAELSRRGIPFYFLNDIRLEFPEIDLVKEFQADFMLPNQKIIIEVQGAYWHSKPKTVESDAIKFAFYELYGYRLLAWWDFDILTRLQELFAAEPALVAASLYLPKNLGRTELTPLKRTKVDTSKGIRTLNRKRAQAQAWKRSAVRVRRRK